MQLAWPKSANSAASGLDLLESAMEVMTADALRDEIAATQQRQDAAEERRQEIEAEIRLAKERQRLWQELAEVRRDLDEQEAHNRHRTQLRQSIDANTPRQPHPGLPREKRPGRQNAKGGQRSSCRHAVSRGEFVWELETMSWLPGILGPVDSMFSDSFVVGNYSFLFVYSPGGGEVNSSPAQYGTLAICTEANVKEQALLRYSIFVKAAGGNFVQWGQTRDEVIDEGIACGPDVSVDGDRSPGKRGIFGLTHAQLLQSEWVEDDRLTVKFLLEVCPFYSFISQPLRDVVEIPRPTMPCDTEALLQTGTCSDVQFRFENEVIPAHSQILCARSQVFQKQLSAGMQESVSKEIVIEDCDAATFRAFLKFLYTDRLPIAEELKSNSSGGGEHHVNGRAPLLPTLTLLAVSHKYEVTRLQRWCEQQLCEQLSMSEVCSILRQAHLLQAKQLEKACLTHIKDHMAEVVKLPAYVELMMAWPQIMLKVSLFMTDTPEASEAAAAAEDAGRSTETANMEGTDLENASQQ